MNNRTDIQIRIGEAIASDGLKSRHRVEAQINGSGLWTGESSFDFAIADPSVLTPEQYGIELGKQLINPPVGRALITAGASVEGAAEIAIRLLLEAAPSAPHTIRWERLFLPVGGAPWPVAISPKVSFTRYIPSETADSPPLDQPMFKLLIAVANPTGIPPESVINVEEELAAFVSEFERSEAPTRLEVSVLPGRTGISTALEDRIKKLNWTLEPGFGSLQNIGDVAANYNGIHILCHGDFKAGKSEGILYLESASGAVDKVADDQLRCWITPFLRLAVFQACRTAAPAPADQAPFVGVAAKMVGFGVPAVVAMQDFVEMNDARVFAAAFYRELMQDGLADKAVNAGRGAIFSRNGNWSIPALFMRLKGGQLWSPDLVRENVWNNRVEICAPPRIPEGLPLTVVQEANGIGYDPLDEPTGPAFDLETHAQNLLREEGAYLCLTGPAGSNKSEQLNRIFCLIADEFLKNTAAPAPILLSLNDFVRRGAEAASRFDPANTTLFAFDRALSSIIAGNAVPRFLAKRKVMFLVTSSHGLSPAATNIALQTLRSVLKSLNASAIFIFSETNLEALRVPFPDATVLVVRPLEMPRVRAFLAATGEEHDQALRKTIDDCGLGDLAAIPWLLNQMRDLVRFGHDIRCRRDVMELVVANFLSRFSIRTIPRASAVEALSRLAWAIKSQRSPCLSHMEMWDILDKARGSQDFPLSTFRDTLIDSDLLVTAGDDAYRLSYNTVCGYFAARFLAAAPQSRELFEDITASLGRLSRIRQWEDTLIFFATLQTSNQQREEMLHGLLTGSSLAQGDQVFLAARLYVEMCQDSDPQDHSLRSSQVVHQMLDTLMWRSRADLPRAYEDRRRAVESLASMRDLEEDAISHLVRLAIDKVRIAFDHLGSIHETRTLPLPRQFDFSGIRMRSLGGLFNQPVATSSYVKTKRPELIPMLTAWEELIGHGDHEEMVKILDQNDPSLSTVAALAFAFEGGRLEDGHPLLAKFADPGTNDETLWGITEVLARQDAGWLSEKVILPHVEAYFQSDGPAPANRKTGNEKRACYLIQQSACAPVGSPQRKYLEDCLRHSDTAGTAIRALAAVPDADLHKGLRGLCRMLLEMNWEEAFKIWGVPSPAKPDDEQAASLQYSAIIALRDVGDEESINLLRSIRTRLSPIFVELSFQVGEEIYWRCTRGLTKRTF